MSHIELIILVTPLLTFLFKNVGKVQFHKKVGCPKVVLLGRVKRDKFCKACSALTRISLFSFAKQTLFIVEIHSFIKSGNG